MSDKRLPTQEDLSDKEQELINKITWRGVPLNDMTVDELKVALLHLMQIDTMRGNPSSAGTLKEELLISFFEIQTL